MALQAARALTFIAQGAREARQAVAQACDVVAGTAAVHALWACLATAMTIKTRGANCKWNGIAVTFLSWVYLLHRGIVKVEK